ncbi:hypothetical protein ACCO45_013387 [Purpureocillium lilacinum]|uniref:Uncharacterized protein n=1 Tax=Purpureocillium lilacinum TaxID=33203 RepID=A0ACC4D603_PURLI
MDWPRATDNGRGGRQEETTSQQQRGSAPQSPVSGASGSVYRRRQHTNLLKPDRRHALLAFLERASSCAVDPRLGRSGLQGECGMVPRSRGTMIHD